MSKLDMLKAKIRKNKIDMLLFKGNHSQNWLARKIRVSTGYMSQLMKGTRFASPKVRGKIQKVFSEIDFEELFTIDHEP